MSNYQNAPATKLLATACACCGRDLVDAVSVETGIGPECRKRYSVDVVVDEAARKEANELVFAVAKKGISGADARLIFDRLADLGFTVLADRIARRFRLSVTAMPSLEDYRAEYRKLRAALAYDNMSVAEVDAAARAIVATQFGGRETPANFVEALDRITCPCRRCRGTGRFIVGTENGAPKFGGGECFRCGGQGFQDLGDAYRNRAYDEHALSRALRAG